VTAPVNQATVEGSFALFNLGSFTDAVSATNWVVDVDWGDSSAHTTFSATAAGPVTGQRHTYADNGTYTVTVLITNATDQSFGSATFQTTVANLPPTVAINGTPASSTEGTAITLTGAVADAGADTTAGFAYTWNVTKNGNAFASGSASALTFTPDDNGTYVVTLTATDKDGASATTTASPLNVISSWKGEGDAADSAGGNNGTLSSVSFAPGQVGQAFSFTGVSPSFVNVGNAPSLQLTNNFTIDAWVNPTGISPGNGKGRIVSKGPAGVGYGFGRLSSGRIELTTYGLRDYDTQGSYIPLNTWTHVAVVFTSTGTGASTLGTASFYVNGVFVESVTQAGPNGAPARISPNNLFLGAQGVQTTSFEGWQGLLDEIGLYSRVLSPAEIQSLYASGAAVKSQSISLANVAPTLSAPASLQSANQNVSTQLNLGAFTDPGADSPWTVTVNWGDNSSDTFTVTSAGPLGSLAHTYATKGVFTVTTNVTDKDAAFDTETFQVVAGTLVINTNDAGPGSLRQALLYSNASVGVPDTVTFNIPTSDPGYHNGLPAFLTIQPTSALPTMTDLVVIDGYSQPGAAPATASTAATLLIELSGASAGPGAIGLSITGSGTTVQGLAVNRFGGYGIRVQSGGGNVIAGNYIGTDVTGSSALGNTDAGVFISSSPGNLIGGTTPATRNVISGTVGNPGLSRGVWVDGAGSTDNLIHGNYIGTNAAGNAALANAGDGISLTGGSVRTSVGGTVAGAGNVISGNGRNGVFVITSDNLIAGNYIGTNAAGTAALSNGSIAARPGVKLDAGGNNNTVGGTTEAARNIISGNMAEGIQILNGASNNAVLGNYIGTDKNGNTLIGNTVSWWKAEGNAADSVDGNGGTLLNGATFATGKVGQAFSFDGVDDSIETSTTAVMNGVPLTVEAWVNPALRTDGTDFPNNVISNDQPGAHGHGFGVNVFTGGSQMKVEYQNGFRIVPGVSFTAGQWYHVAVVYTSGNVKSYVNGALVDDFNFAQQALDGAALIRIGKHNDDAGTYGTRRFFKGLIDEPAVYNRALTAGEVQSIVAAGSAGKANDLGNRSHGVQVSGAATSNTIGGTAAGAGNVISGNLGDGVNISSNLTAYGTPLAVDYTGDTNPGRVFGTAVTGSADLSAQVYTAYTSTMLVVAVQVTDEFIDAQTADAAAPYANDSVELFIDADRAANDFVPPNRIGGREGFQIISDTLGNKLTSGAGLSNSDWSVTTSLVTGGYVIQFFIPLTLLDTQDGPGVTPAGPGSNLRFNLAVTDNDAAVSAQQTYGVLWRNGNTLPFGDGEPAWVVDLALDNGSPVSSSAPLLLTARKVGNVVQGNLIGTDPSGSRDLGNRGEGVQLDNSPGNLIGGSASGARNIISGNDGIGVLLTGGGTVGTIFSGNFIGTNATGTGAVGNTGQGLFVAAGAHNNVIGTDGNGVGDATEGNLISGNTVVGVYITDANTNANVVAGNLIGTNADGTGDLGNGGNGGVRITNGAKLNLIGTNSDSLSDALERNVISGNTRGMLIDGVGTDSNIVAGNYIGTAISGTGAVPNDGDGILITGGPRSNRIGTNSDGINDDAERNVIAGNFLSGIHVVGAGSDDTVLAGNNIGVAADGTTLVPNARAAGNFDVLVDGGAGPIVFGALTAGQGGINVTSTAAQINAGLSTASATVSFTGPVTFGGNGVITTKRTGAGSAITFNGVVTLNTDTTLTGTSVTFNDPVAGGGKSLTVVGNAVLGNAAGDTFTGMSSLSVSETTTINGAAVSSSGGQTYSGAVALGAGTTLTSTGTGNITFGSTVNGAFSLAVNTAGIATFGGAVGGSTPLASLMRDAGGSTALSGGSVTTAGGQTYNDAVTLGANTTLAAGAGGVTFAGPVTVGGAYSLAVNTPGTTAFGGTVGTSLAPLVSLTTDAGGETKLGGDVNAQGNTVTFNDAVTLTANVTLTDIGNVAFANTVNGAFALTVNTPGVTTFGAAVGSASALASLTTDALGSTAVNGGAVTTTGGQTYGDKVTLGAGTTLVSTSSGAIQFADTINGAFGLTVNTAGATSFGAAVGDGTPLASVTTDAPGSTALNGGAVTTSGSQTYNNPVALGANTTLTSTGTGNVAFVSTLNGGWSLTVNTAGTTTFGGAAGGGTALASIVTDAAGDTALNGGSITTSGSQTYHDGVTLGANATMTGTTVTFLGTVAGGTHGLTISGNTVFGDDGGDIVTGLTTLAVSGTSAINAASVSSTGNQTYAGATTLGTDLTVAAGSGDVTFASAVNGGYRLTVNAGGVTTFGATVGSALTPITSLTTDSGGQTRLGGNVFAQGNTVTFNDPVVLTANVTVTDAGAVTFATTVNGAFALTVNTPSVTTFGGAVGGGTALAGLITDAGGSTALNGGAVTTTGGQTYGDSVTLGTNATLVSTGSGAIQFGGTIDGASGLTVNTSGATTFAAPVGTGAALSSVTTDAPGTTALNGGAVTTSGAQTYNNPVTLGANIILTSTGSGNIAFANSLNGGYGLTVNTGGTTTFGGAVGGATPLTSLTTDSAGSTAVNGGSINTSGSQAYSDGVTLGANATLTGTTVTFLGTVGGGSNGLTIVGNAVFGDAAGDTITGLTTLAVSGTSAINTGSVSSTGNQTYTGAATLGTDVTVAAGSGHVTFASAVNGGYALSVNASGVTTFGATVGSALTPITSLTTDSGGQTRLGGNISAQGNTVTFNDPVVLTANVTVTDAGSVTFANTVNGAFTLTVHTPGVTTFGGAVGGGTALASLTTDAAGSTALNGGAFTTTGGQSFGDNVTLGAGATLVSTGAGAIQFAGTINGAFGLTVNTAGATTFGASIGGSTALTSVTTDAPGTTALDGGAVTTSGAQTYNNPVTLGANTILTSTGSGNIGFANTLNGGSTLTVNTGGTTSFGGAVGGATSLTSLITDAPGSTAVNGSSISTSGSQVYNDAVTLGANVTLTGTTVTFLGTVDGTAHGLTITGNAVFGDAAGDTVSGLTTLTISGTSAINTGTVSGSGHQTYTGPVTLGTNVTISSGPGNVTFTNTINGAYTLTVNSAGVTTFNGEVGGLAPLVKLFTDAPGSTVVNAAIHTTGDIDFGDLVQLVNNVVITDIGPTATGITFRKSANGHFDLTLTSSGPITFLGAVGGVTPLALLRVNAGGSITDGEPDSVGGPPGVTITADQLLLVAGPASGIGSSLNHLQTRASLQAKAGTGGIYIFNTGGLAQIDPTIPALSSTGPIDANFTGGAGDDSFDLSGIATPGSDGGKPGGFEDDPPTKPTLAQIRITDFSGFNELDFGTAAGGVRLDLSQADGQTLQDVDGQGHKIVLAGNFQQLVGSKFDDRFTGTTALQQGSNTTDRFGLDTQLKDVLGSVLGQSLYNSVSGLLAGFGGTMDTVELAQLLGQFADNTTITGDQLGQLVGSFQTTIDTGAGNDRVSAGFMTSVNLGSGNNQFTSTVDAGLMQNVLGGFAALSNVSAEDVGIVLGGFRTDVTAGDGNDSARGSFLGTFDLGAGNNLFEGTLDDAQLKALGNVVGGFGGKVATGDLASLVGGFAESITAGELVNLVGGFAETLNAGDLTDVVGGFIDALKNNDDQLGILLGGFGAKADAAELGIMLGGFGGKVVEIDNGELTNIVGGFIDTLDPTIQSGIAQLVGGYIGTGNPLQFGQSLAAFGALDAEEAATLSTLVGGFGTSADDQIDFAKLGEALGGYGGKVGESTKVDEISALLGGFGDILSKDDIVELMGGFVDGVEAGTATFDKLGNVLGGFADEPSEAVDIGRLLGGFGGKAGEIDNGELANLVGGFIDTLDPTIQSGIAQLVGGYAGNAIQFGQSLAGFGALETGEAATLIALVGGFGTVPNDPFEINKLGQALGGYGGKIGESTKVDEISALLGGFIDIYESADITRLTGGFIDGLEIDAAALGRVLGGFGQTADAAVMGVVLGGYADNGVNLATLTTAVGGWLSTLDQPELTLVFGGFGVNSSDKLAGKVGSFAGHGGDLGNILQGFLGNLDTGEIVTLAQMLGGFTAQGQADFVTLGEALGGFADGLDDPQRTTLGNIVGGFGETITDPQIASLLGGFGVLPPDQVAEVLGGFAETAPSKDLRGALGSFGGKLTEPQLGTIVGGFAGDLKTAEMLELVGGFTADGLTAAQVGQLTTLLGGYLANPPTTTPTQLGHFLDSLTEPQLGAVLGGFVEAVQGPGLSVLLAGLGSFVITGSGDDVVGGGLLTRFATGAGNDKLFCGPTDPGALKAALAAKGIAPPAINHLLDTAGGVFAGGKGNDSYFFVGNFLGHVHVKETFEIGSVDSVDFSAFTGGPLVIDLGDATEQTVAKGKLWLTLSDDSGIENFTGGSGADQAWGNDQDNVMFGAQPLPAQLAATATTNAPAQVVYLDFSGVSTTEYSKTHPQHVYTTAERNAIQSRLVTAYQAFNYQFTQVKPVSGPYTTLKFNETPSNSLPGGQAKEIDFANLSRNALVVIDVNGFLGGLGQPAIDGDGDAGNGIDANLMAMSATIAAHELGHAVGLRHGDSFGPPLFGIHNPPGVNAYTPAFSGGAGALESTWHVMASPASVGSSLFDAIGQPFFGERELVKLAFADHAPSVAQVGTLIVPESPDAQKSGSLPAALGDTKAQPLTLLGLSVPNTMSKGYDAGKQFVVTAVDVAGQIKLKGAQSESDYYSFTLPATQNVTIEVMSTSLTRYLGDSIDSVVRIYDQSGALIAENDDQFEPQDSNLLDLSLPGGTYYVQVDTYFGSGVPHTDVGKYEMLIYTFAAGNAADLADVLDGESGNDTLNGDRGNDFLLGGLGNDKLTGAAGDDSFDGGTGIDRLVELGDVNFKLSDTSLTGMGSDKLTSIEQATLVGGPSANSMDAGSFSGFVVLQGRGGNDSLTGGAGGNVLIGDAGDDQLTGASGDDVMIGGAGADRITGSAGDDIMVAGSTSLDYNPRNPTDYTGLSAIHAEWNSSHPFNVRTGNILGTPVAGALNLGFYLIPTGSSRTVFDDTSVDSLTGSQGQDWYFVHTGAPLTDIITSFGTGDLKTSID